MAYQSQYWDITTSAPFILPTSIRENNDNRQPADRPGDNPAVSLGELKTFKRYDLKPCNNYGTVASLPRQRRIATDLAISTPKPRT
jgi:hypothetical protein